MGQQLSMCMQACGRVRNVRYCHPHTLRFSPCWCSVCSFHRWQRVTRGAVTEQSTALPCTCPALWCALCWWPALLPHNMALLNCGTAESGRCARVTCQTACTRQVRASMSGRSAPLVLQSLWPQNSSEHRVAKSEGCACAWLCDKQPDPNCGSGYDSFWRANEHPSLWRLLCAR